MRATYTLLGLNERAGEARVRGSAARLVRFAEVISGRGARPSRPAGAASQVVNPREIEIDSASVISGSLRYRGSTYSATNSPRGRRRDRPTRTPRPRANDMCTSMQVRVNESIDASLSFRYFRHVVAT